jgi:hypothetical protein
MYGWYIGFARILYSLFGNDVDDGSLRAFILFASNPVISLDLFIKGKSEEIWPNDMALRPTLPSSKYNGDPDNNTSPPFMWGAISRRE